MSKFRLDLAKFKKVKSDDKSTTLKHPSGHEITIAHGGISPEIRQQLKILPHFDDGGAAKEYDPDEAKRQDDNDRMKAAQESAELSNKTAREVSARQKMVAPVNRAYGGPVAADADDEASFSKKKPDLNYHTKVGRPAGFNKSDNDRFKDSFNHVQNKAYGGVAGEESPSFGKQKPVTTPGIDKPDSDVYKKFKKGGNFAQGGEVAHYAKGTPNQAVNLDDILNNEDNSTPFHAPDVNSSVDQGPRVDMTAPQTPEESWAAKAGHIAGRAVSDTAGAFKTVGGWAKDAATPVMQGAKDFAGAAKDSVSPDAPQADESATPPAQDQQMPAAPPQSGAPQSQPAADPRLQQHSQQPGNEPGSLLVQGAGQEIAGIGKQADAQAAIQKEDARNLSDAQSQMADRMQRYQQQQQEVAGHMQEVEKQINDGKIQPDRYTSNQSLMPKIAGAIGLVLGGFGSGLTGQPNLAAKFVNDQIDRDIEAQKADLNSKHNLLGAYMKQYGNINDAMAATKATILGQVSLQLQTAAAKQGGEMAQAVAQQQIGQINQRISSTVDSIAQRQVMKQEIEKAGHSPDGLLDIDPAILVDYKGVPQHDRQKVVDEIGRAQNTRKSYGQLMKLYDASVNAMSGIGHISSAMVEPRELAGLRGGINTTVTDLTGTARQAEFDSVAHNLLPKNSDITDHQKAVRRQSFIDYLNTKSAAPTAKSHGIDLDTFSSTSTRPEASLDPKARAEVAAARRNPSHPNSAAILAKYHL